MNEERDFEVTYEDGTCESEGLGLGAKLAIAAGGGLIAGAVAGFGFAKKKFDKITTDRIDKKIEKLEKKKEEILKSEEKADKEDSEEEPKEETKDTKKK